MIITIATLVLITVSFVFAVRISTSEGMVFEKIGKWATDRLDEGKRIYEPLLLCEWCMPSVYSLVAIVFYILANYLFTGVFYYKVIILYPAIIGISSMITGLTFMLKDLIGSKTSYNEKKEEKIKLEIKNIKQDFFDRKNKNN